MTRIAIVGDIHLHFNASDINYFNSSPYDLIFFVGDLSRWMPGESLKVAGLISQLESPAYFIPGNHDTINLLQLIAEVKQQEQLAAIASRGQEERVRKLKGELLPVTMCGYSVHPVRLQDREFDIIAARPFSMGGNSFGSQRLIRSRYGVDNMEASAELLKTCIDASESKSLIFLGHNGPAGLGNKQTDIWGCDFKEEGGDFGDPDLSVALEYAGLRGKQVLAVVAGHMHRQTKSGALRRWHIIENGIHYINAAYVPRIFHRDDKPYHHHVSLTLSDSAVTAEDILVEGETTELV